MALEAPLRSSTGSLQFKFSHQGDMSATSESDGIRSPFRIMSSPPPPTDSSSLRPDSMHHRLSSYSMHILSPSDIVGPSPVTSNGTETTEIEDDIADDIELDHIAGGNPSHNSEMLVLSTNLPEIVRQGNPEEAVSVIHAPESFASWASSEPSAKSISSTERSSPKADGASQPSSTGTFNSPPSHPARPPISTDVKPVRYSLDSATPRAQDLQDMLMDGSRLRSSSTSSLEKIDEQTEAEGDDDDEPFPHVPQVADEIGDLRTLLHESWTLCNTLANLSSMHRPRAFRDSGTPDAVERAWKACWKLCHRLYDNQDEDPAYLSVKFNLDLCRDFCQALFDVRERRDELADSVLRVSFELNNHLYSAQDNRNLPEQFRERTLDFYITLCHRLMKQRGELLGKTDQLLGACWALAEMLFSLRQNRLDGKPPDGELLLSAVQACWGLGDIFKDSWSKVNTDRNTPRPSQASFFSHASDQTGRESRQSNRSSRHSKQVSIKSTHQEERPRKPPPVPETPVTEFEDTPISPESRSPQMPNLLVLGPSSDGGRGGRWSSSASNLSSYSHSSNRTSSTATTTTATEDPNVARAKILVLRAAMNLGFDRDTIADPKTAPALLQKFVQNLPADSFGPLPRDTTLLQQYKNSVLMDAFIPRNHTIPSRGKRVAAVDMAKSIQTLANSSPRYAYLRELFGFVFNFSLEEVESRRHTSIAI
ncbi:hypothetical protein V8C37DRAFT_385662 [Trichoderma ceciliae]